MLTLKAFRMTKPLDFFTFLRLESSAKLVITDSGGVQEEACILRVPTVTVRDNTERPETVAVGSNILAGVKRKIIAASAQKILSRPRNWRNPFGDGHAAERIVRELRQKIH